jgi:MFS family permease
VSEFPDPIGRAKATSIYVLVTVAGGSLGLLLGGVLTTLLSWHWIFIINLPVGIVTLIAGAVLLEENVGLGIRAGLDVGGALLSTGGMMLAIYAMVTSTTYGWASVHTLIFGGSAVLALAAFFLLESRLRNPMMPMRVLRSRGLGPTSLARGLLAVGMFGSSFLGVLFFQHLLGLSSLQTGFAFLPQTLMIFFMMLGPSAWIGRTLSPKLTAATGFSLVCVGLVLFSFATPQSSYFPLLFVALLVIGLGAAMTFTPLLTIAMSDLPPADAGLGSGLINASQQMSVALAIAALGVISSNRTKELLATGSHLSHALAAGYRLGFIVGAVCVALGVVVCSVLIRNPDHAVEAEFAPVVEAIDI